MSNADIVKAVIFSIVAIVLLYGQLTIDWWQERKKK